MPVLLQKRINRLVVCPSEEVGKTIEMIVSLFPDGVIELRMLHKQKDYNVRYPLVGLYERGLKERGYLVKAEQLLKPSSQMAQLYETKKGFIDLKTGLMVIKK